MRMEAALTVLFWGLTRATPFSPPMLKPRSLSECSSLSSLSPHSSVAKYYPLSPQQPLNQASTPQFYCRCSRVQGRHCLPFHFLNLSFLCPCSCYLLCPECSFHSPSVHVANAGAPYVVYVVHCTRTPI